MEELQCRLSWFLPLIWSSVLATRRSGLFWVCVFQWKWKTLGNKILSATLNTKVDLIVIQRSGTTSISQNDICLMPRLNPWSSMTFHSWSLFELLSFFIHSSCLDFLPCFYILRLGHGFEFDFGKNRSQACGIHLSDLDLERKYFSLFYWWWSMLAFFWKPWYLFEYM